MLATTMKVDTIVIQVDGTNVQAYDAQLTSNIRQNVQNANYTLVLADGEKHIYCSATGGFTWTIPANSSATVYVADTTFLGGSPAFLTLKYVQRTPLPARLSVPTISPNGQLHCVLTGDAGLLTSVDNMRLPAGERVTGLGIG